MGGKYKSFDSEFFDNKIGMDDEIYIQFEQPVEIIIPIGKLSNDEGLSPAQKAAVVGLIEGTGQYTNSSLIYKLKIHVIIGEEIIIAEIIGPTSAGGMVRLIIGEGHTVSPSTDYEDLIAFKLEVARKRLALAKINSIDGDILEKISKALDTFPLSQLLRTRMSEPDEG